MSRLKVYTASKLSEAPLWRALADDWKEIEIVARWPFIHVTGSGLPSWPGDCAAHGAVFWQHDHDDVARCDVVLVYGKGDGTLRGALVEAGMGIALGKYVIVVGSDPSYGTWQFHPSVARVRTLDEARSLMRLKAGPFARSEDNG